MTAPGSDSGTVPHVIAEAAPESLPPGRQLAGRLRGLTPAEQDAILAQYAPAVDYLTGVRGAAAWLGMQPSSVYRDRNRVRADGTRAWPEPDKTELGHPLWSFRRLALHRANLPGRGAPGRKRPRRQTAASGTPGPAGQ